MTGWELDRGGRGRGGGKSGGKAPGGGGGPPDTMCDIAPVRQPDDFHLIYCIAVAFAPVLA